MKKISFPQQGTTGLAETTASRARATLRRHKGLFKNDSDILGYAIAAKDGTPYVQVFVRPGHGALAEQRLPDRIDDLEIYYLEASPRALR